MLHCDDWGTECGGIFPAIYTLYVLVLTLYFPPWLADARYVFCESKLIACTSVRRSKGSFLRKLGLFSADRCTVSLKHRKTTRSLTVYRR